MFQFIFVPSATFVGRSVEVSGFGLGGIMSFLPRRSLVPVWGFMLFFISTMITAANAQESFRMGLSGLPSLSASGIFGSGAVTIRPILQVGYQKIGLNFNLPLPRFPFFSTALDLSFKDANMWIGSLGVTAECSSGLFFALKAQGNAKRRIAIDTPENFLNERILWDGEGLEWWSVEGSAGYWFTPNFSLLAGLRRDHLSVKLTNPRFSDGFPVNWDSTGEGGSLSQRFYGDFMSKLWIPYVGVQIAGESYRASFLWSPFATGKVNIPTPLLFVASFPPIILAEGLDLQHKVSSRAQFLECNIEYDYGVSPNIALQLWGSGNWLSLRGSGSLDSIFQAVLSFGGNIIPLANDFTSTSDTATYRRYTLAGGLSARLSF